VISEEVTVVLSFVPVPQGGYQTFTARIAAAPGRPPWRNRVI